MSVVPKFDEVPLIRTHTLEESTPSLGRTIPPSSVPALMLASAPGPSRTSELYQTVL